jgi:O-antigen biosynthesis protein
VFAPKRNALTMNRVKVLIMGYVWPEITSSAAGLRDWNFIRCFQDKGWDIIYSSAAKENMFTDKLKNEGIQTVRLPTNCSSFDSWIAAEKPDFVIFDRFVTEEQFGWRVAEHSPESVRILDTQDLHFVRRARQAAIENGVDVQEIFDGNVDFDSETTLREIASIYRSDSTLLISDFELNLLHRQFHIPLSLLQLWRFSYPTPLTSRSFEDRRDFAMIGNFRHAPNIDAIHWLRTHIWPTVRSKLPDAEVHVYGAYAPKEMMQLSDDSSGFIVKGPVKDHFAMLEKHKVNLAPLRFGAGIKGKITDGWWAGTPCVTTPIGCEGMVDGMECRADAAGEVAAVRWGGGVARTSEEFAERCVELYTNQDNQWMDSQRNGYSILSELYSAERNSKLLIAYMMNIRDNLAMMRRQNVIGSILRHQLYQGTKYFSMWIQEKNSKGV